MEQEIRNSLGGDMPQERLDAIKQAWMARYGKTEQDWNSFKPHVTLTATQAANYSRPIHEWDSYDEESSKMEFIFCPEYTEMGWRYRTKAQHFTRMAERSLANDNPVEAAHHSKDAAFWARMSEESFAQANANRRKL